MLIYETDSMSELSQKLIEELQTRSYRDIEDKAGVSRGAIEKIVRGQVTIPRLETLEKLATYWSLPLWRVVEMAGIDLGLPTAPDDLARQLTSLSLRLPEIEPIVHFLLKLHPEDLRGVVAYLQTIDRLRDGLKPNE